MNQDKKNAIYILFCNTKLYIHNIKTKLKKIAYTFILITKKFKYYLYNTKYFFNYKLL